MRQKIGGLYQTQNTAGGPTTTKKTSEIQKRVGGNKVE